jgi:hypothetical protein
MSFGQIAAYPDKFGSYQSQSTAFEPNDDFADQSALHTIWLHQH